MSAGEKELKESRDYLVSARESALKRRLSRRAVIRGGAMLAIAGSGGMAALLAACGGSDNGTATATTAPTAAATGAAPSGTASAAATATEAAFDDTTGTPPYTLGLANADVDPKWQRFPYVYKYNWKRYPFNAPLTRGGEQITVAAPPSNYDLMHTANGVQSSLYYQGLWHSAIHAGLNLDSISIEPDLASKTEPNADYTTWTFTIPPGVKFHDIDPVNGREITADDVAFSYQRYIDTSIWNKGLQFVDKVSAPDARTVRFDMKQPQVTFDAISALPYYLIFAPEHYDNQDRFLEKPIGTGAFYNSVSIYQDHGEALRNPNFNLTSSWMDGANANQSLPFLDKLTLQYYSSEATTRAAFVAGQADDYPITYLDPSVLEEVLSARPEVYVTVNSLWATYPVMFFWNYDNPLFQDVRVRRALSMAIDRETLMQNVYSGAAVPGGAPVAFDLLGQDVPPPLSDYGPYYQYDPAGAQALMKEAGYEDGFKIQFEVTDRTQQLTQFQVYKGVQQYWRQNLKVEVEFVIKDTLSVTNDALNHAFPDLIQQTAVTGYDAYSLITPLVHSGGGGNRGQVSDPDLDSLLDRLGAATSPDDVLSLTNQTLQRMQDQVTYIWLGWPQAATLTQPWLHGQSQNLYAYNFYFGIENMRSNWIDQGAPDGRGGTPI